MGFAGSKTNRCIFFDEEYGKCRHEYKQKWYSFIIKPSCDEMVDKKYRCELRKLRIIKIL